LLLFGIVFFLFICDKCSILYCNLLLKLTFIMARKRIVIIAMPEALSFDVMGPSDVFSLADYFRLSGTVGENKEPFYEVMVVSATPDLVVRTASGVTIACEQSIFSLTGKVDTLIIGGLSLTKPRGYYPEVVNWVRQNAGQFRRVCSVCIGAFILAEAGLLSGKNATTHWHYWKELSTNYENIKVNPDPIFVKDGNIYTSAGISAGIDLALALVEEDLGRDVSLRIAQMLVLYLRRPGNQSQFSQMLSQQLSNKQPIKELQSWIMTNLKNNLSIELLAERAAMSPRNFARVFSVDVGMTPGKYVEGLRVESSRRYLEETNMTMEQIASECGFGTSDTMRKIFHRSMNMTPYAYRSLFGSQQAQAVS
jgi:transcriptional regulator GlxA family with amidase domain